MARARLELKFNLFIVPAESSLRLARYRFYLADKLDRAEIIRFNLAAVGIGHQQQRQHPASAATISQPLFSPPFPRSSGEMSAQLQVPPLGRRKLRPIFSKNSICDSDSSREPLDSGRQKARACRSWRAISWCCCLVGTILLKIMKALNAYSPAAKRELQTALFRPQSYQLSERAQSELVIDSGAGTAAKDG